MNKTATMKNDIRLPTSRVIRHALLVLIGALLLAPRAELQAAQQLTYDGAPYDLCKANWQADELSAGARSTRAGRRWLSPRILSAMPTAWGASTISTIRAE